MVLEAGSFQKALDRISIKPSLMILDINLPDLSGWKVAQWLEQQVSDLPIIVTSGLPPDAKQLEHFKPVAFLEKPFAIDRLMYLVKEHAPLPGPAQSQRKD